MDLLAHGLAVWGDGELEIVERRRLPVLLELYQREVVGAEVVVCSRRRDGASDLRPAPHCSWAFNGAEPLFPCIISTESLVRNEPIFT